MTDTEKFHRPGLTDPTKKTTSKLKFGSEYFQSPKVNRFDYNKQQHVSSPVEIWNVINSNRLFEMGPTQTTINPNSTKATMAGHLNNCKMGQVPSSRTHISSYQPGCNAISQSSDLVAKMGNELLRMTKTSIKSQDEQLARQSMQCLNDYLDSVELADQNLDVPVAAPVYFTTDDLCQGKTNPPYSSSSSTPCASTTQPPSNNTDTSPGSSGFFKSIRGLVDNVLRLPSLLRDTWNNSTDIMDAQQQQPRSHVNQSGHREEHLFFDVDDIDFLPDDDEFSTPHIVDNDNIIFDADFLGQCEAFFWDVLDATNENNVDDDKQKLEDNKQQQISTVTSASPQSKSTTTTEPPPATGDSVCPRLPNETPQVPEENNNNNTHGSIVPSPAIQITKQQPVSTLPSPQRIIAQPCIRRFVSTPDQENGRMSVVRPRKRQGPAATSIRAVLMTPSTPIAVKDGHSSGYTHTGPRRTSTLSHQEKNRKEKRRSEIVANMHEDFDLPSGLSDTENDQDDDLLPLTARNLREPSCLAEFCGGSINSSFGSGHGGGSVTCGSVPRRNSISFRTTTAAYEDEFPVIAGGQEENVEVEPKMAQLTVTSGGMAFEIPNSPQKRRMMVPAALQRNGTKHRTSSVMSSSVDSSSFVSGGKFWGSAGGSSANSGLRRRTVSEESEDVLIEFVSDGVVDYLADVFSSDEDYSSDGEEDEEEDDDESTDEGTESESDEWDEDEHQLVTDCIPDLPDSGVEEKKVSWRRLFWSIRIVY